MRDFTKVYTSFWSSDIYRKMAKTNKYLYGVSLYLQTCRHANMIGLYYLPINYLANDLCFTVDDAEAALKQLESIGYCLYDKESEYVWIVDMAQQQLGPLKKHDNKVKFIAKQLHALPSITFLDAFMTRYQKDFHLTVSNTTKKSVSEQDGINPLRSIEIEKEIDIDIEIEIEKDINNKKTNKKNSDKHTSPSPGQCLDAQARPRLVESQIIFTHWQTVMAHPQAKLDDKRKTATKKALKFGYTTQQLCDAIDGCAKTPHNIGDNERGQRYDGLQLILRSADHIDRFIANAKNPPVSHTKYSQAISDTGYIQGAL